MRRKRKRSHPEVELPITPMLDMAFQLLTFFIMTYKPSPTEGQFSMNLPPAQAAARPGAAPVESAASSSEMPAELKTLTTTLRAGSNGGLAAITLSDTEVTGGVAGLKEKLASIKADPDTSFDQILIQIDPLLKWEDIVQVIDVFSSLEFKKISFSELKDEGAGV